jgi:glutamate-1-semialdehyde 2,1-aminomutase
MPKADSPPTSPVANLNVAVKSHTAVSSELSTAVAAAKQRFIERNPTSARLFEEAAEYLPGGNTRTLLYSAPFPICMKKGENYQVFDEDNHVLVVDQKILSTPN